MEILWSLFDEKDYPQKDIVEFVCEPNDSSSSKLATLLICPAGLAWLSLLSSLLLLLLLLLFCHGLLLFFRRNEGLRLKTEIKHFFYKIEFIAFTYSRITRETLAKLLASRRW